MGKMWTVVQHNGERMDLERGFERMEVTRPIDPLASQIFMALELGRGVDEGTLRLLTRKKQSRNNILR